MKKFVKSLFKLYKKMDYKISHTLTVRARSHKKIFHIHPLLRYSNNLSSSDLIKIAREYDIKEFFQYNSKPSKDNINIKYRLILGIYNITKLIILSPLRMVYRFTKVLVRHG